MKSRKLSAIAVAVVLVICMSVFAAATGIYKYGDANGDGTVDQQDLTELWDGLANGDVSADQENGCPDVNGDGVVNLKDVTLLQRYLDGNWNVELPDSDQPLAEDLQQYEIVDTSTSKEGVVCTSFRFGQSVQGRDLVCWSIQQGGFDRTVLLNFAIHGWEDSYAADGQLLVDLGNALVEHYSQIADLQNCRLLIVPCANPLEI